VDSEIVTVKIAKLHKSIVPPLARLLIRVGFLAMHLIQSTTVQIEQNASNQALNPD
jgi:hypothetical protein